MVSLRLGEELLLGVDRARGDRSRGAFIRESLEAFLAGAAAPKVAPVPRVEPPPRPAASARVVVTGQHCPACGRGIINPHHRCPECKEQFA